VLPAEDEYAIPTVFDAEAKSTAALTAELELLAERARTGALTPPELAGATFTLTHVEARGVDRAAALIIPPQAAAVAAGAMRAIPIVRDGAILPGHMLTLTLASDHRILYGEQAARFLSTIKDQLEVGELD
jgi:pyruvate dehydrogenase E2 component (dihydrolipoamide acetyltransferase)